jgi:nitrate reductase assembly molybdenum cofactor insertion protein NarJ
MLDFRKALMILGFQNADIEKSSFLPLILETDKCIKS